ncbi:MAG: hypothetical protein N2235_02360 [Fischerella sp.]|nr:hypothetical protein [Fischerella sp.]
MDRNLNWTVLFHMLLVAIAANSLDAKIRCQKPIPLLPTNYPFSSLVREEKE